MALINPDIYVQNTKIAEICGGKIDFQVRVRITNLWATQDRLNPNEEGAIQMVFLDKDRDRIHATVRKDLIPQFKDQLQEGCAYVIEKFMVAKNDASYRSTSHKHKLNFMRGTKVWKVSADEIPTNHYDFMPFQEILTKTKEDQLLDVIGHVVEKNPIKETEKNGKISRLLDATIEDLGGNRVHCSLWDDFADKMQSFLDSHDPSLPVVILIQLAKLKKYMGTMGVSNSFHGTKLLLNANIVEVSDYIERMHAANVELTQGISQVTGPVVVSVADDLLHTPRMTIEDLIEATEKCCGSVLAWACEFSTDVGWFYQACTKCASRINFLGGQLYCDKCKMPRTAIPRFKIHLQVIDDTGSITFVLFDRIVAQFIGRTAQDLLDGMNNVPNSNAYPSEFDVFLDKQILFKIEVSDANLYRNWRGYTVKKLSYDPDVINRFTAFHGLHFKSNHTQGSPSDYSCPLGDNTSLVAPGEGASTNTGDVCQSTQLKTPTSKTSGKDTMASTDITGTNETPTSKVCSKEPVSNVDRDSVSVIKQLQFPDVSVSLDNTTEAVREKHGGKRAADVGDADDSAPKETKIVCVKTSG